NGTDTFSYTVTSGGVTETANITVTVNAVNDAPVNTLPATFTTSEDTSLALTGLSISDVDSTSGSVTLSVDSGALSATSGGGVTASLTPSGTLAAINSYLAGASAPMFTPAADFNGVVHLTMVGSDGSLTDTDASTITVSPVADIVDDQVTTNEDRAVTFNPIT